MRLVIFAGYILGVGATQLLSTAENVPTIQTIVVVDGQVSQSTMASAICLIQMTTECSLS